MANVLIVDDHKITALGMGMIIKKIVPDAILHFSDTYLTARKALAKNPIDLIILDLSIPGSTGPDMVEELRSLRKDVKILIFSGRDELLNAPAYLQKGANGYLSKTSSSEETEAAIKAIVNGETYVSSKVREQVMKNYLDKRGAILNPIEILSAREKQVYDLLMAGKWTKEIADELNVKYSTVSTQKATIFQKFNVDNIVDLVRRTEQLNDELNIHLPK